MLRFIRDCLVFILFGFILLALYLVAGVLSAHGVEAKPADSLKRVFVVLSVATVAGNIADAEVTAYELRTVPRWTEHNPLYGPHPSRAALWGWECTGAAAAILLSYELRKHGHVKLALVPLALTTGSSLFCVQHDARWKRGKN